MYHNEILYSKYHKINITRNFLTDNTIIATKFLMCQIFFMVKLSMYEFFFPCVCNTDFYDYIKSSIIRIIVTKIISNFILLYVKEFNYFFNEISHLCNRIYSKRQSAILIV